jgi:ABC-type multidrug transport system ATPase subunit
MFGLLGPNGAGKSTLMRTIATLQEADSGTIRMGEIDVRKDKMSLRKMLGYLPQEFGVYPRVSAITLLDHLARLKGISNDRQRKEQVVALLHRTNLYEHRHKFLGGFSGGMKQRFGIAQALLGNPQLIIVDEPTAGLDPSERNRFYNLLSEIGENIVVILSTHIIDDVNTLCNRLAIIQKGQLKLEGEPQALIKTYAGKIWKKEIAKSDLQAHITSYPLISYGLKSGKFEIIACADASPENGFEPIPPTLEHVYFAACKQL